MRQKEGLLLYVSPSLLSCSGEKQERRMGNSNDQNLLTKGLQVPDDSYLTSIIL